MDIKHVEGPDETYSDSVFITLSDDTCIRINYPHGHKFDVETDIEISHGEGWEKVS